MENEPEHTEARAIKWTFSYSEQHFLPLKTLQRPWGGKSFLPEGLQRDPSDLALNWRVMAEGHFATPSQVARSPSNSGMGVGSHGWSRLLTPSIVHYACQVILLLSFYRPPPPRYPITVLPVLPHLVPLQRPGRRAERGVRPAVQDHHYPAEPQGVQQHRGLHRPVHLQDPQGAPHRPADHGALQPIGDYVMTSGDEGRKSPGRSGSLPQEGAKPWHAGSTCSMLSAGGELTQWVKG